MAVLPDADRFTAWAALMRRLSAARSQITISKADLRDAVNAADAWASDNAASYNQALPQAARDELTPAQKALLLAVISLRRAGESAD